MTFKSRIQKKMEALMGMVKDGNLKFQEALDRINGIEEEEKLKPTRRSTTTKGYASKYHTAAPNPKRRGCKTLNGPIFHRSEPRGYDFGHKRAAPTIDEVRAFEQKNAIKVRVRNGFMYGRRTNLPMDEHLADEVAAMLCN